MIGYFVNHPLYTPACKFSDNLLSQYPTSGNSLNQCIVQYL